MVGSFAIIDAEEELLLLRFEEPNAPPRPLLEPDRVLLILLRLGSFFVPPTGRFVVDRLDLLDLLKIVNRRLRFMHFAQHMHSPITAQRIPTPIMAQLAI